MIAVRKLFERPCCLAISKLGIGLIERLGNYPLLLLALWSRLKNSCRNGCVIGARFFCESFEDLRVSDQRDNCRDRFGFDVGRSSQSAHRRTISIWCMAL